MLRNAFRSISFFRVSSNYVYLRSFFVFIQVRQLHFALRVSFAGFTFSTASRRQLSVSLARYVRFRHFSLNSGLVLPRVSRIDCWFSCPFLHPRVSRDDSWFSKFCLVEISSE